jgi:hypothetical protein
METPQDNDTMPLKDGFFNFTPMFNGERVRMRIDEVLAGDDTRGPGFHGYVVDLDTKQRYAVYGHPCGLPNCYCDARIEAA